jgi:hypothetical protein
MIPFGFIDFKILLSIAFIFIFFNFLNRFKLRDASLSEPIKYLFGLLWLIGVVNVISQLNV